MSNKQQEIIHAYRHLLRWGTRAVQYAKPARFTVRDQLREGFRFPNLDKDLGNTEFDAQRIKQTVWFLKAAASERGLEHTIVKNLVAVAAASRPEPWKAIALKKERERKKEEREREKGWEPAER